MKRRCVLVHIRGCMDPAPGRFEGDRQSRTYCAGPVSATTILVVTQAGSANPRYWRCCAGEIRPPARRAAASCFELVDAQAGPPGSSDCRHRCPATLTSAGRPQTPRANLDCWLFTAGSAPGRRFHCREDIADLVPSRGDCKRGLSVTKRQKPGYRSRPPAEFPGLTEGAHTTSCCCRGHS